MEIRKHLTTEKSIVVHVLVGLFEVERLKLESLDYRLIKWWTHQENVVKLSVAYKARHVWTQDADANDKQDDVGYKLSYLLVWPKVKIFIDQQGKDQANILSFGCGSRSKYNIDWVVNCVIY